MIKNQDWVSKQFNSEFYKVYKTARECADQAEKDFVAKYGEPFFCGFAYVVIPNARQSFVKWLKANNIGDKHYKGGWCIWNPNENPTQSMDIKIEGAKAFVKSLQDQGFDCYYESMPD
jgi:hypothetical protein